MTQISVGQIAPDFEITLTNGKNYSSNEYRGRYLLLYFYPKDSTPGCTIEAKDFSALKEEFNAHNVSIVGVSRDDIASHQKFCDKYDLQIDLAADVTGDICKKFGTLKEKSLFGKKYIGIERSSFLIDPEGHVVAIWRDVIALGHAKKLLEYVKELALKS